MDAMIATAALVRVAIALATVVTVANWCYYVRRDDKDVRVDLKAKFGGEF
jgi:hypothetical protein